jgi:general secretion pathway protein K
MSRSLQKKKSVEDRVEVSDKETGAVLLTTLLVMAIMAALAVAIMDDVRLALKRTANISDYAQADWYVHGAEDYVGNVLGDALISVEAGDRSQILEQLSPIILPIDDGFMQINVSDGSHCFNLNSLTTREAGQASDIAVAQFVSLIEMLDIPSNDADRLVARIVDWIDSDSQSRPGGAEDGHYLRRTPPIRTANTPLKSVMELRAIDGMTADIYAALRPWVCIAEPYSLNIFNLDTAQIWHAPILATYLGGEEQLSLAVQIIQERPPEGYGDFKNLQSSPALTALGDGKDSPLKSDLWSEDLIKFSPPSLWVELSLQYRNVQRSRSFHFTGLDRDNLLLTYRGWGKESFKPDLDPDGHNETDAALLNEDRNP